MTGWTDEARQASADARKNNANGKAPGQETHHAAMKAAQADVAAKYGHLGTQQLLGKYREAEARVNRNPNYSRAAVNNAIASSNRSGRRIGGREASAIHRLLSGGRS
jgi:hypothetical protein